MSSPVKIIFRITDVSDWDRKEFDESVEMYYEMHKHQLGGLPYTEWKRSIEKLCSFHRPLPAANPPIEL
jgi:hypothetical protein